MKSGKALNFVIFVVIGIICLIFLANNLIGSGKVPTFQKYMEQNMPATSTTQEISKIISSITLPTTDILIPPSLGISSSTLKAYLAQDEQTRERGLGGVDRLNDNEGMLFVFPSPAVVGFWMKDMKISIDMVWIDQNKTVVGVSSNISPDTFPQSFSPTSPVLYVLEISAGVAEKIGIKTGTKLQFDLGAVGNNLLQI